MLVKFISGTHLGKTMEYHQSCNDWITVDWISDIFRITDVAFDLDGMIRMCSEDEK